MTTAEAKIPAFFTRHSGLRPALRNPESPYFAPPRSILDCALRNPESPHSFSLVILTTHFAIQNPRIRFRSSFWTPPSAVQNPAFVFARHSGLRPPQSRISVFAFASEIGRDFSPGTTRPNRNRGFSPWDFPPRALVLQSQPRDIYQPGAPFPSSTRVRSRPPIDHPQRSNLSF